MLQEHEALRERVERLREIRVDEAPMVGRPSCDHCVIDRTRQLSEKVRAKLAQWRRQAAVLNAPSSRAARRRRPE